MSKEADDLYEYALSKAVDRLASDPKLKKSIEDRAVNVLAQNPVIIDAVLKSIDKDIVAQKLTNHIFKEYLHTSWKGQSLTSYIKHLADIEVQRMLSKRIEIESETELA